MKPGSKRRGHSTTLAAALALAACLGQGAGSSSGYPGAAGGGSAPPPQRSGQPPSGGYPPQQQYQQQQQQQQQQYRPGPGQGQAPPSSSQGAPPSGPGGAGGPAAGTGSGGTPPAQQQQQDYYGRGARPMGQQQQQQQPNGFRGGPPSQNQPYGQAPGSAGGGYGAGGYPGGQQQQPGGYGGRAPYPSHGMPPQQQQQQPQQQPGVGDGGGLLSRITSKLKGMDGPPGGGVQPGQGYGGGGRYGGGAQQYPQQGSQDWQPPPSRPGMALQPTGPRRGLTNLAPSGYHPQRQDDAYGGGQHRQPPSQPHPQEQQPGGGGDGPGIWSRFKGKVFQGDANGDADEGPPSFRPGGSVLKKKDDVSVANANPTAFGGPGAYGNPFPTFAGPPGMAMGQPSGAAPEPSGPGVAEVTSVDGSIVMVLKPNELTKKKRKFKQDGANRLQVIATFDHCLTAFHAKDGKTPCLKTTDALEQNELVMLPEAAKKVRFLRSDFKRRMEADGKTMTPDERVAALEDNLRKVYSTVAMEGGVHMNSIGPAIESQLDNIPLREGVDDMTAALAWRAIPLTIFCAGYGNVAMEVLRRGSPKISGPGGVFTPHLRLVANFFKPDDTMTIIGMYDTVPLIHEAKKSGATLMEFLRGVRQENAFASRPNVLLLGSELSDLGLGNGLPGVEERISVGFLKLDEHVLDKLPRYAQAYDVLIIGDGDMSYANEILHEVVG